MDAVLLDLDGTLVDTEPYWIESQHLLANRFGIEWTREDELALVGHSPNHSANVLQSRGVALTSAEIIDVRLAHILSRLRQHVPWKPGAEEFLGKLRGSRLACALVTMSPRGMANAVMEKLPSTQFQVSVTGSDCINGKPHPEPYLRALALLGTDPNRAIAVEDSNPGVQSAESAGLRVLVVPGMVPVPSGATRTPVSSLADIDLNRLCYTAS